MKYEIKTRKRGKKIEKVEPALRVCCMTGGCGHLIIYSYNSILWGINKINWDSVSGLFLKNLIIPPYTVPIFNYVVVNWITSNELFFKKLLFFTYINFFLNFFSCFLLRKQQVICLRLSPSLAPTHNIYKSLFCYPHSCFSFSLTASECAFPLCQQLQSFHRRWWLVASAITCNINFFWLQAYSSHQSWQRFCLHIKCHLHSYRVLLCGVRVAFPCI